MALYMVLAAKAPCKMKHEFEEKRENNISMRCIKCGAISIMKNNNPKSPNLLYFVNGKWTRKTPKCIDLR